MRCRLRRGREHPPMGCDHEKGGCGEVEKAILRLVVIPLEFWTRQETAAMVSGRSLTCDENLLRFQRTPPHNWGRSARHALYPIHGCTGGKTPSRLRLS